MFRACGKVISLFTAEAISSGPPPAGGYPTIKKMKEREEVYVEQGMGIKNDRWYGVDKFALADGTLKDFPHNRNVSFFLLEDLEALQKDGFKIEAIDMRRNILVSGININDLVGAKFKAGKVEFEGSGYCRGCKHIEQYTQEGIAERLHNCGGIRAKVLTSGIIKKGDLVCKMRG